jgi:hypothetical protein
VGQGDLPAEQEVLLTDMPTTPEGALDAPAGQPGKEE